MGKPLILIVEDEGIVAMDLANRLRRLGYEVAATTDSGEEAVAQAAELCPDLVLMDVVLSGPMDGIEAARRIRESTSVPVVYLTAYSDAETLRRAALTEPNGYILKPFEDRALLSAIHMALYKHQAEEALRQAHRATEQALRAAEDSEARYRAVAASLEERNRELAALNEELRCRNEDLDAFAHTVAHNLKGPLGVVAGFAEMLSDPQLQLTPAEQAQYAQAIMTHARKMSAIIGDLLLLAEVRVADVRLEPLDMGVIVSEALSRLAVPIGEARATVSRPHAWPLALGYAPWVEEVWVIYLSNALQYGSRPDANPPQPPQLALGAEAMPGGVLRFWVADRGYGVNPAELSHLFTPFNRLGGPRPGNHGLGLSIARRIVEKLGGQVAYEDGPGGGSLFSFTLRAGA